MERYAVIVAGGKGLRFGTDRPKQFLQLKGKPVFLWALEGLLNAGPWEGAVLVFPSDEIDHGRSLIERVELPVRPIVVEGGEERFHSVRNGLRALPEKENALVAVHDAARPLIRPEQVSRILELAEEKGNAVPAVPITDSVRSIDTDKGSTGVDRKKLRTVQTPQCFKLDRLKQAMEGRHHSGFTDEANVMENVGEDIQLCEGAASNIKITSQIDLELAECLLEQELRREKT